MTFADFLVTTFAELHTPGTSRVEYAFKDTDAIHACIERLLRHCHRYEKLSGLADNLNNAAKPLHALWHTPGSPEAAHAHDKMLRIAVDFENYLQLIATVRYPVHDNQELFDGSAQHFGIFGSQLGQLLRGNLRLRGGASPAAKSPYRRGKPIVTFNDRGTSPKDRSFLLALDYRNEVHDAEAMNTLTLAGHVQQLCAAFLFATEENLAVLQEALFEFRDAMGQLVSRCRGKRPPFYLPLAFALMKNDKGRYVLDRSASNRGETLDTLQHKAHAAPDDLAIVLLGEPGAGKSTVVHELAVHQAQAVLNAPFSRVRVPVLLEAKDIAEHRTLFQLVCSQLGCVDEAAIALAREGRLLIVLDGLNEVPTRLVSAVKTDLRVLAWDFPAVSFVITGRRHVSTIDLPFRHLWVCDLTVADIRTYVEHVVRDRTEAARFFADLQAVPRLLKLCHSPLLLWMLTEISRETETATNHTRHVLRIPENTGRLLKQFMTQFLDRERDQGNLCTADGLTAIDPATVHDVLGYLAFKMRESNEVATTRERCRALINERLPSLQSNIGAIDFLHVVCNARILDLTEEETVRFFHELGQEYFAAAESVRCWRGDHTATHVLGDDADWMETRKLFFGLLDPAEQSQLIPRLAESNVAGLALCVMDAINPSASHQEQVVRHATGVLGDDVAGNAIDAYLALSRVWSESARRALLNATSDARGMRDFLLQYCDAPLDAAIELVRTSMASRNKAASAFAALVAIVKQADFSAVEGAPEKLGALLLWAIDSHPEFMGSEHIRDQVSILCSKAAMPAGDVPPSAVCDVIRRAFLRGYQLIACTLAVGIKAMGLDSAADAQLCSWCAGTQDGRDHVLQPLLSQLVEAPQANQALLRLISTRLLVEQQWQLLATALTRLDDKEWLQPLLPAVVDKMLRDGQAIAAVKELLAASCSAEHMQAVMRASLNATAVDRKSLLDALAVVEDNIFTHDTLVAYFSQYVFARRYDDARITLAMIDGRCLELEWVNTMVDHLTSVDCDWLAADLAVKVPRAGRRDELLRHASRDIEAWLQGSASAAVLRHACRSWWQELPSELRGRILDSVLSKQHEEAIVDGWSPEAVAALADRLHQATAQGCRIAIGESLARRLTTLQTGGATQQMTRSEVGDSAPLSRRALRRDRLQRQANPEDVASIRQMVEFDCHAQQGNVDAAIAMLQTCEKKALRPKAADWVLRLLQSPQLPARDAVAAGRLMVAFDLTADFVPECEMLMPFLLADDKPGIARVLAESGGVECKRTFAALLLKAFEEALSAQDLRLAEVLATQSGMKVFDNELRMRITDHLRSAGERRDPGCVRELVRFPKLMSVMDWDTMHRVLIEERLQVEATVTRIGPGFAFVDLMTLGGVLGRAYLRFDRFQSTDSDLTVQRKYLVTLRPSGKYPDRRHFFDAELVATKRNASDVTSKDRELAVAVTRQPIRVTLAQKGQTREGTLCVHDGRISAVFDGDDRDVVVVNEDKVPDGVLAAGKRAAFYILSASKRTGVEARFERLQD